MIFLPIKFIKLHQDAIPFVYTREDDACMDMYSLHDYYIRPNTTTIVKTGIAVEMPKGYFGQVKGRSGLSSKGILVHTGTIEYEYRGDIGIILTNISYDSFRISKGDRLAQFSIHPIYKITLVEVDKLSETSRGTAGYGSSGVSINDRINEKTDK